MRLQPGTLVRTRGRDWIIQPGSTEDFLLVKPLGGREEELTGIVTELETLSEATFGLPDPTDIGDARSAGLLRDAAMLSFRASTGPFRSFGKIAVTPRPYQLVPLLMALKLNPVRLLIADDVGIGKTIEALLIARELIDRGEIKRFSILCPPHLADQWQSELQSKFHLDAVKVLAGSAARLERDLNVDESLFDRYPITIVSTDFIKSDRRRSEFLRVAPELIIVDEAHTASDSGDGRGARQQRNRLLKDLSSEDSRHIILVTATPHSGNEGAFRSLLTLLRKEFADLPDDLTGRENEKIRRELARYFVQRKRGDIRQYLGAETDFPEREEEDVPYSIHDDAKALFRKVLSFAREELQQDDGTHRQRVRWWATLGLLRALASSPAAAAATLRNRAAPADTESVAEADEIGRRTVMDELDDDAAEGIDITPGSQIDGETAVSATRQTLTRLANEADALKGKKDKKLKKLVEILQLALKAGRAPIVFCRFIDTADYVAEELRKMLSRGVEVVSVTGRLAPEEREARVFDLANHPKRVLVATDCLSEGINLQQSFDSVIHYDLSWNPTRHEQREGRVDRYGQHAPTVFVNTMYGIDNQIDGIVLDVLLRKHRAIRSSLGISVPVPADSEQVIEAIFEGLLLRGQRASEVQQDSLFANLDEYLEPKTTAFSKKWDSSVSRERRSRTMFAQETIKVDEVAQELSAIQSAIGDEASVRRFTKTVVEGSGGFTREVSDGTLMLNIENAPREFREYVRFETLTGRFSLPVTGTQEHFTRTHPAIESMASYVLDTALDTASESIATRLGAMRTEAVELRTTLCLLRFRFHITTTKGSEEWQTLAEETVPMAFVGESAAGHWLNEDEAIQLFSAEPGDNILPAQSKHFTGIALSEIASLNGHFETEAGLRSDLLLKAHRRVRTASGNAGLRYKVEPLLPVDVLGIYVYLPVRRS